MVTVDLCLQVSKHYVVIIVASQPLTGLNISAEDIFLDNVQCEGNEESLLDCAFSRNHNCDLSSGAGVRCQGVYIQHLVVRNYF